MFMFGLTGGHWAGCFFVHMHLPVPSTSSTELHLDERYGHESRYHCGAVVHIRCPACPVAV